MKTATPSLIQQAAQFCYRWYTSPLEKPPVSVQDLTAFQSIIGAAISVEDMSHWANGLRQNEDFAMNQADVIGKWGACLDSNQGPSEGDARALIQTILKSLNHSFAFGDGIRADRTLIERGKVLYSEMEFPGTMRCWTLHLTVSGKGLFLNDHMEVEVSRGDMMLFHPEAIYHYGLHPGNEQWEHLWVVFQPRPHWLEWLDWDQLDERISYLNLPDSHSFAQLEGLFRQMIALGGDPSPYRPDLQHARLEELLIRAKEYSTVDERTVTDKRIQSACKYIQNHLADKFGVEDVARACNLSSSRLAHLFKQHLGISLKSWSNNIRLQQARKLLLNTDKSIAMISREIGYQNPDQFTRYFKRTLGCTPRYFRQSFKKEKVTLGK